MHIAQLTLSEAILYAAVGMAVVMAILALLAALVWAMSKAIAAAEGKRKPAAVLPEPAQETPKAAAPAQPAQVTLIDCDEATAAVLMAIVAERSGIPLNRLAFQTIRLLEE